MWAVERGSDLVTFRVAEDSTLADIDDHALVLQPTDFVRVPHPVELSPELVNRWATIMSDYGLMQPVVQLGRTPIAVTPEELAGTKIERDVKAGVTWTVYRRVLRNHQGTRSMARCPGKSRSTKTRRGRTAHIRHEGAGHCEGRRQAGRALDAASRRLAEGLYAMRLALEAE